MDNCQDMRGRMLLRCASQSSLDESSQWPRASAPPPPHHASKVLDYLDQLRRDEVLCDVRLVASECADGEARDAGEVGDLGDLSEASEAVPAHRAVLAACSPYFRAMFTQFDERTQHTITIRKVEASALRALVDYVYNPDSLTISEDNVQSLLSAASLLQVGGVREQCCTFLATQLHADNALGIRAFADLHACAELASHAQRFVERHFAEVAESEELLALSAEQLCALLASDNLAVPTEEKVLECVVRWVGAEPERRRRHLAALMERVRLPLLSQECLVTRVQSEPLLGSDLRCKDLLIEALTYHLLRPEQRAAAAAACPRARPRRPPHAPKALLVVGGQAPKAIRHAESLDLEEGCWRPVADMLTRRCRAGLAVVEGRVYAVGGFNGTLRVRSVDVYDVATDTWSFGPSMRARRSTLGVAVLEQRIYAVGGFDGSTGLSSAEMLDTRSVTWHEIAPMSTRRSSVGVAVLQGKIYAVGGYDGSSRQCLASVECYDPAADAWAPVPDMSARRSGAGVGVLEGVLYAVGGHDGPAVRRSVEAWRPGETAWRAVAPMAAARRNAGVAAHGGKLYVVGGDDGASNLPTVEVYEPASDTWSTLDASMAIGRSYAGVCVVDKPA